MSRADKLLLVTLGLLITAFVMIFTANPANKVVTGVTTLVLYGFFYFQGRTSEARRNESQNKLGKAKK